MGKIIKFNDKYIDDIVNLFLVVFENEPWNDNWPSPKKAKNYLLDIVNTPGFKGYIHLTGEKISGVLLGNVVRWWEGDEFFIKEFFVDKKYQGKGIGTKIIKHLETKLDNEDIKTFILLTQKHTPAAEFYEKNQFKVSSHTVFMFKNI